jgi:hypothetical protein
MSYCKGTSVFLQWSFLKGMASQLSLATDYPDFFFIFSVGWEEWQNITIKQSAAFICVISNEMFTVILPLCAMDCSQKVLLNKSRINELYLIAIPYTVECGKIVSSYYYY